MEPNRRGVPHCIFCGAPVDSLTWYCDHCKKVLTRHEVISYPSTDGVFLTGTTKVTTPPESGYREPHQVPCTSCGTLVDERYNLCPHCRQNTRPCPVKPLLTGNGTASSPLQGSVLEYQSCRKQHRGGKVVLILCALFLLVIAAGVCVSTPSSGSATSPTVEQVKSMAITVPYVDLVRYNEEYIGKYVKIRGTIIQSHKQGETYVYQVGTRPNHYDEDVLSLTYQGPRFIEGDLVDIWGRVDGLKTESTVLGTSVTVPEISSNHLEQVPLATQTVIIQR